jgi:glutamate 5-kinase
MEPGEAAVQAREQVRSAKRVVVKVGSSSLAPSGTLDASRIEALVAALVEGSAGREVILVTSGAVAAGLAGLGLAERPSDVALLQAAASVGQGVLVEAYRKAFSTHGKICAQVLLSPRDTGERTSFLNARRALDALLARGVVPVVNENDVVATDELRFGDNDRLAALVAVMSGAGALVLLSDVEGVLDAPPGRGGRLIEEVRDPLGLVVDTSSAGSGVGTGGMATKLSAARLAHEAGVATLVGSAGRARDALEGVGGTALSASSSKRASARALWLRWASVPSAAVVVDDGAAEALRRRGSLLGVGVTRVEGSWEAGAVIEVRTSAGTLARGVASASSREAQARGVLVHADDLALLEPGPLGTLGG